MMSYELERIEELCRERGWSHYRLALEMDTSPNNIGNLFRRTTVPSIPTIRRICEVMGITMAQFYSTDGVQVTLNEQQRRIMDLYDKLDPLDKSKDCRPRQRIYSGKTAVKSSPGPAYGNSPMPAGLLFSCFICFLHFSFVFLFSLPVFLTGKIMVIYP